MAVPSYRPIVRRTLRPRDARCLDAVRCIEQHLRARLGPATAAPAAASNLARAASSSSRGGRGALASTTPSSSGSRRWKRRRSDHAGEAGTPLTHQPEDQQHPGRDLLEAPASVEHTKSKNSRLLRRELAQAVAVLQRELGAELEPGQLQGANAKSSHRKQEDDGSKVNANEGDSEGYGEQEAQRESFLPNEAFERLCACVLRANEKLVFAEGFSSSSSSSSAGAVDAFFRENKSSNYAFTEVVFSALLHRIARLRAGDKRGGAVGRILGKKSSSSSIADPIMSTVSAPEEVSKHLWKLRYDWLLADHYGADNRAASTAKEETAKKQLSSGSNALPSAASQPSGSSGRRRKTIFDPDEDDANGNDHGGEEDLERGGDAAAAAASNSSAAAEVAVPSNKNRPSSLAADESQGKFDAVAKWIAGGAVRELSAASTSPSSPATLREVEVVEPHPPSKDPIGAKNTQFPPAVSHYRRLVCWFFPRYLNVIAARGTLTADMLRTLCEVEEAPPQRARPPVVSRYNSGPPPPGGGIGTGTSTASTTSAAARTRRAALFRERLAAALQNTPAKLDGSNVTVITVPLDGSSLPTSHLASSSTAGHLPLEAGAQELHAGGAGGGEVGGAAEELAVEAEEEGEAHREKLNRPARLQREMRRAMRALAQQKIPPPLFPSPTSAEGVLRRYQLRAAARTGDNAVPTFEVDHKAKRIDVAAELEEMATEVGGEEFSAALCGSDRYEGFDTLAPWIDSGQGGEVATEQPMSSGSKGQLQIINVADGAEQSNDRTQTTASAAAARPAFFERRKKAQLRRQWLRQWASVGAPSTKQEQLPYASRSRRALRRAIVPSSADTAAPAGALALVQDGAAAAHSYEDVDVTASVVDLGAHDANLQPVARSLFPDSLPDFGRTENQSGVGPESRPLFDEPSAVQEEPRESLFVDPEVVEENTNDSSSPFAAPVTPHFATLNASGSARTPPRASRQLAAALKHVVSEVVNALQQQAAHLQESSRPEHLRLQLAGRAETEQEEQLSQAPAQRGDGQRFSCTTRSSAIVSAADLTNVDTVRGVRDSFRAGLVGKRCSLLESLAQDAYLLSGARRARMGDAPAPGVNQWDHLQLLRLLQFGLQQRFAAALLSAPFTSPKTTAAAQVLLSRLVARWPRFVALAGPPFGGGGNRTNNSSLESLFELLAVCGRAPGWTPSDAVGARTTGEAPRFSFSLGLSHALMALRAEDEKAVNLQKRGGRRLTTLCRLATAFARIEGETTLRLRGERRPEVSDARANVSVRHQLSHAMLKELFEEGDLTSGKVRGLPRALRLGGGDIDSAVGYLNLDQRLRDYVESHVLSSTPVRPQQVLRAVTLVNEFPGAERRSYLRRELFPRIGAVLLGSFPGGTADEHFDAVTHVSVQLSKHDFHIDGLYSGGGESDSAPRSAVAGVIANAAFRSSITAAKDDGTSRADPASSSVRQQDNFYAAPWLRIFWKQSPNAEAFRQLVLEHLPGLREAMSDGVGSGAAMGARLFLLHTLVNAEELDPGAIASSLPPELARLRAEAEVLWSQSREVRLVQEGEFPQLFCLPLQIADLGPRYTRELLDHWGCLLPDADRVRIMASSCTATSDNKTKGVLDYRIAGGFQGCGVRVESGSANGGQTCSSCLPHYSVGPWVLEHRRDRDVEYSVLAKMEALLRLRKRSSAFRGTAEKNKRDDDENGEFSTPNGPGGQEEEQYVHLALTRTPCLSCLAAIRDFKERFPGVALKVGFRETRKRF